MTYPFVPCSKTNYKQGRLQEIKYIVIHYTGNNGDTAYNNCIYFKNNAELGSSAHYFVDEYGVYQSVRDEDTAWHCGTRGKYYHPECRNANSIGIELCSRKNSKGFYFKDTTLDNASLLVQRLMDKYSIDIENVVRHYDVTHKMCPEPFVRVSAAWKQFKEGLDNMITQEQFNQMANNWLITLGEQNTPEYAKEAVQFFMDQGTFKGNAQGQAMANKPLTRAEYCVLRKREIDKGL